MSVKLLSKIAVYTGIFSVSGALYFFYSIQDGLKKSTYFKESMKLLQQNSVAMEYLGEPLKHGYLNLTDTKNNFCDGSKARFEVPVKGGDNSGTLYLWARRENPKTNWDVHRLVLSPSDATKNIIIIKNES